MGGALEEALPVPIAQSGLQDHSRFQGSHSRKLKVPGFSGAESAFVRVRGGPHASVWGCRVAGL
eukprot:5441719-Alexandrium_andersonii.AAC.1